MTRKTKIKDISQVITGKTPPTEQKKFFGEDYPFITPTDITSYDVYRLDDTKRYLSQEWAKKQTKYLLPSNSICYVCIGSTVGKMCLTKIESFTNQQINSIICKNDIVDTFFIFYKLRMETPKVQAIANTRGSGKPIINKTDFQNLEIEIPDLSTQNKISSILSAYDDLIENNTRRIQILEEITQRIYREWFVSFRYPGHENDQLVESDLGMIPEGWGVKRVDEVATIYRGRSYKSSELKAGLPFVNLKNIKRNGGYRHEGIKQYSGTFKDTQIAYPDDVIIAVTDMTPDRGIIARAARVPNIGIEMFIFSMDLVKPVPDEGIDKEYLLGMFLYSTYANEVKEYANGVNVLHLSPERIAEYKFAFPTQSLRRRYAEIVDPIYSRIDNMHLKIQSLRKTRDLLLSRLISGKIDVSELNIDIGERNESLQ